MRPTLTWLTVRGTPAVEWDRLVRVCNLARPYNMWAAYVLPITAQCSNYTESSGHLPQAIF